jgi:hypothetical protein
VLFGRADTVLKQLAAARADYTFDRRFPRNNRPKIRAKT